MRGITDACGWLFAARPQVVGAVLVLFASSMATAADDVDYTKQIKPLLKKHCVSCHGPKAQKSGLRVDTAAALIKGGDRGAAVVPGKSKESLLIEALVGESENIERMPLEKPALSKKQIALFKRWVDQGADYPKNEKADTDGGKSKHWSFQQIRRPKLPTVKNRAWIRNPIDLFVLAKLESLKLRPSPQADRRTLLRRVSLDLRGLPPSPEELRRYLRDTRPGAYERMVERMLASPQYGERWGRHWLDVARYADSNGFTIDGPRSIWKYRDWVVKAINADMPFDEFTRQQLAGDLMIPPLAKGGPGGVAPDARLIATGFHRNTLINQEGGTDKEQFRVDAVADRVNTTGSVFLGLTIGCARCHAHKFDPISQRDYYEMFAIFNDCDEPTIRVPTPTQQARLQQLTAAVAAAEKPLKEHDRRFLKGLADWEKRLKSQLAKSNDKAFTAIKPTKMSAERGTQMETLPDKSIFVDFSHPPNDTYIIELQSSLKQVTAIRLETLTHKSLPKTGPGYAANGNFVLTEFEAHIQSPRVAPRGKPRRIKLARAVADHAQSGFPASHAIDGNKKTGWAINLRGGKLNVNREAIFFPAKPIDLKPGEKLIVKLRHDVNRHYMIGHFRLSLSSAPAELLSIPASLKKIVLTPAKKRTKAQQRQLQAAYLNTDAARKPLVAKLESLRKQKETLEKTIPTTMVLKRRKKPRQTHIHIRGDFLRKGAKVTGRAPSVLPPIRLAATQRGARRRSPTRLDFANWLVDPQNPLTARVTVNRVWQRFFGLGIVETENDFGTQGRKPTHPELLDWLASELRGQRTEVRGQKQAIRNPQSAIRISGAWSLKRLHRLIVTSATYRQSSSLKAAGSHPGGSRRTQAAGLISRDPRNRLLARQSRLRLNAETIRDTALQASGLLSPKMLGPSVHPPQPKGIYVVTQRKKNWPVDTGADRYRRGMYTYFWRSSPYPFLMTFDAPDANTTCTRRSRSNTPLQALTLANDQAFIEMAKGFASRVLSKAKQYDEDRLRYAYLAALTREPTSAESAVMLRFLTAQRRAYEKDKTRAKAAAPSNVRTGITQSEAAAWTAVCRVLLNLDEFITRE